MEHGSFRPINTRRHNQQRARNPYSIAQYSQALKIETNPVGSLDLLSDSFAFPSY